MQIVEFISSLRRKGIVLKLDGGDLLVKASGNALTADLKSAIKDKKQEIIATLRQIESGQSNLLPSLSPMPAGVRVPLSFNQQRLWFMAQLNSANPAYNVASGLELRGKINQETLSKSIGHILNRHEAFRTSFYLSEEEPYQQISGELSFSLECMDLRHFAENEKQEAVNRLIKEEARWLFDLTKGSLYRIRLVRLE